MNTKNFNKLSPAKAELLALLAEECAEVIQIVGKILRHGYDSAHPDDLSITNRELLEKELGHVYAAVELMDPVDVSLERVEPFLHEKKRTVQKYLHHNKI